MVTVDRPRAPAPALSSVAIGASRIGVRARPGSAETSELTQAISRNSRNTWRKAKIEPMPSTPKMRLLSPGLAENAKAIGLLRMSATKPTITRNDVMPMRKILGEVRSLTS